MVWIQIRKTTALEITLKLKLDLMVEIHVDEGRRWFDEKYDSTQNDLNLIFQNEHWNAAVDDSCKMLSNNSLIDNSNIQPFNNWFLNCCHKISDFSIISRPRHNDHLCKYSTSRLYYINPKRSNKHKLNGF